MARIFTDGAEMGDGLFWDGGYSGSVDSAAPAPFDGDYYYDCDGLYTGGVRLLPSAYSEFYYRQRMYYCGSHAWTSVPCFRYGDTDVINFRYDGLGRLAVYAGATLIATGTRVIGAEWILMEVHIVIDDAPNGVVNVYLDGVEDIDFTGDTKYTAYSTIDNVEIGSYARVDDLAFNDTTGGDDDSWCGPAAIVKVYPNDNGTDNDWDGSDGNQVDNYLLVDEFPKDDDTTYVSADSSSSGTQDQYGMSDYDGTDRTIVRIYPEARARITGASANTIKLGIKPSGSADDVSAGRSLTVANYSRVVGDEYKTNPADAGAWEEADIDAIEGIVEVG